MIVKRLRRNTNVKPRATKLVLQEAMNDNPTSSGRFQKRIGHLWVAAQPRQDVDGGLLSALEKGALACRG